MKRSNKETSYIQEIRDLLDNNIKKLGGKLTVLYLRLSRDDDKEGESNSIANQRVLLMDYAKKNNFKNVMIFYDDGVSGVTFKRKDWTKVLNLVEYDMVETLIVKDMSRLGRNYLEVGNLMETILPMHDVRLIAVNDRIDSQESYDDFIPVRNIMNELYAKDISQKVRSVLRAKSRNGRAIGLPPLGYMYDGDNKNRWVIDPEGAEIVRKIYSLRVRGESVVSIIKILKRDKILIPSMYALEKGFGKPAIKAPRDKYLLDHSVVRDILMNQSYVGDIVNFKTYSKSFKLKQRLENSVENWEIHKNVHEPIIDRAVWESIQKTFGDTKYRKPKNIKKKICLRVC